MIDWLIIYKNIINKANTKEQKEYSMWLKKSHSHVHYSEKMAHYSKNNAEFIPLSDEQLLQNLTQLKAEVLNRHSENSISKEINKRRIKILIAVSSSAAAIILSWFILNPHHLEKSSKISDVNVPTLILESGSSLSLEGDEMINDSHHIERIDNDKISYLNKRRQPDVAKEPIYNTLIIPNLYTYTIILDDSTEVYLNANSELRYPVSFTDKKREVFLKGEGYFKVAKDKKPFIVHTEEISVRVYGTEFNINTHDKEDIKTVLLSGAVSVTIKSIGSDEIHMLPNQKFSLNSISEQCSIVTANPENDIAWRTGFFKYDQERLSVILNDLTHWYGVEFNYSNIGVKNIPISLKIKKATDLENILRAIESISGARIIKLNRNKYEIE